MSGAHRIQKPPSQFRLTLLLVPVRLVWRSARAAGVTVGDWRSQAAAWLQTRWARLQDRWDRRDPFEVEPAAAVTSPDPIPVALPAPAEAAALDLEPEPLRLTPREALTAFHTVHPLLPGENLRWNLGADSVHGEVSSLDCNPAWQRKIVEDYADALETQWKEQDAGDGHTLLTATGVHAGVTVIVTAVQVADDTIPLRVYDQAVEDETLTDTLTTQAIPEKVLAEVLGQ